MFFSSIFIIFSLLFLIRHFLSPTFFSNIFFFIKTSKIHIYLIRTRNWVIPNPTDSWCRDIQNLIYCIWWKIMFNASCLRFYLFLDDFRKFSAISMSKAVTWFFYIYGIKNYFSSNTMSLFLKISVPQIRRIWNHSMSSSYEIDMDFWSLDEKKLF